jgi:outer membrane receptor protein involved in Fe transport
MGNHRQLRFAVRAALAAAAASAVVPVAMSQTAPATTSTTPSTDASIGEVVVTGTRIQSANLSAVSPITTVTAAAIADTGLTRVEDILNNLPFVFAGENSNVSNGADGTATVDLRGLGPSRTLVLVNGRRLGPGAGDGRSYSDINEIPAALIDHIDILTGGASATYGADAVAGVVNFVMNTHYQGVKVDAGYDFYQHGNSNSSIGATAAIAAGDPTPPSSVDTGFGKNVSVTMGSNFADDRGNATAYLTYDQHAAILQSKYDYSSCTLSGIKNSGGQQHCGGSGTSAKNGAGGYFQAYGPSGALFTNTVNGKTGAFEPYNPATDSYNYGPLNYQQVPSTRWTAGTFLDYEINTHATAYAEIMYTNYNSQAQIAPSGDFFQSTFIPCSDPLLTAQEKTAICNAATIQGGTQTVNGLGTVTGATLYIGRRNVEGGPRIATFQTDAFRSVVGVRGDVVDGWTYDVYGQRGTVDNSLQNLNYLSNANIINALDVVTSPTTGQPVCASVLNKTDTACVPWNIWVPNGVTKAATTYLSIPLLIDATVTEYIAEGNLVGDLGTYGIKLPTADEGVKISIGSEYRDESAAFQPDEESLLGNAAGSGGPSTPVSGGFTVKEVYGEFTAPLADHAPFADTLALDGGYRYSSYSEGFKTNTFKAGLVWAPIHDVKMRASFDRAVRAPNIGELYSPQVVGLDGSTDPCAGAAVGQTTPGTGTVNGNTFAQCARTGVTLAQFGHINANSANQYNGLLGGNPDLKPETANTWSAGLVLQPSFVPNFSASFDYFDIKLVGTVAGVGADNILNNCVQNGSYCNDIHRDSNGSLFKSNDGYVIDTSTNIGSLSTRGIDVKANYSIPLNAFGKLAFALEGTKLITLDTQNQTGGSSYNCAGYYGVTCGNPNPAWRSVLNTTWTTPWDGLEVNLRWRYFGTVSSQYTSPLAPLTGSNANPSTEHIDAYSWFDLSASFALVDNVRLRLGVNNILDKSPPIVSVLATATRSRASTMPWAGTCSRRCRRSSKSNLFETGTETAGYGARRFIW